MVNPSHYLPLHHDPRDPAEKPAARLKINKPIAATAIWGEAAPVSQHTPHWGDVVTAVDREQPLRAIHDVPFPDLVAQNSTDKTAAAPVTVTINALSDFAARLYAITQNAATAGDPLVAQACATIDARMVGRASDHHLNEKAADTWTSATVALFYFCHYRDIYCGLQQEGHPVPSVLSEQVRDAARLSGVDPDLLEARTDHTIRVTRDSRVTRIGRLLSGKPDRNQISPLLQTNLTAMLDHAIDSDNQAFDAYCQRQEKIKPL